MGEKLIKSLSRDRYLKVTFQWKHEFVLFNVLERVGPFLSSLEFWSVQEATYYPQGKCMQVKDRRMLISRRVCQRI